MTWRVKQIKLTSRSAPLYWYFDHVLRNNYICSSFHKVLNLKITVHSLHHYFSSPDLQLVNVLTLDNATAVLPFGI